VSLNRDHGGRLTVSASYLLKAAAGDDNEDWKAYVPADNTKDIQSMVGSLTRMALFGSELNIDLAIVLCSTCFLCSKMRVKIAEP